MHRQDASKVARIILLALFIAITATSAYAGSNRTCVVVDSTYWFGQLKSNSHTSCPFARNVTETMLATLNTHPYRPVSGYSTVRAWSPVTRRSYIMRCYVHYQPQSYIFADCRGGVSARVVLEAWYQLTK